MDGVVSTGDGYDVIVWTKGADARLVESWWQKYDSRKSRCLKQRKSMRTLQDLRCFVAETTILEFKIYRVESLMGLKHVALSYRDPKELRPPGPRCSHLAAPGYGT